MAQHKKSKKLRVAIVATEFYPDITKRLLAGAYHALSDAGVPMSSVTEWYVPGAFEVPQIAERIARSKRYDAVITLGLILKGETEHDRHLSATVFKSLLDISREYLLPIGLGMINASTIAQAHARTQNTKSNRGYAAAMAALTVENLKP